VEFTGKFCKLSSLFQFASQLEKILHMLSVKLCRSTFVKLWKVARKMASVRIPLEALLAPADRDLLETGKLAKMSMNVPLSILSARALIFI